MSSNDGKNYVVASWNVDKLTEGKLVKIKQYMKQNKVDIMCINEIKDTHEMIIKLLSTIIGYKVYVNAHNPARYHGVAVLIRDNIQTKQYSVDMKIPSRKDSKDPNPTKGRLLAFNVDNKFIMVSTYTPNAGTGLKYLEYRLMWDSSFFALLGQLKTMLPVMWLGDINVAPQDIDVSDPVRMKEWAGFTPQECKSIQGLFDKGWIDIWRKYNPGVKFHTWLGNNCGMRLDSVIISDTLQSRVKMVFSGCCADDIISDHYPIGISVAF
jgi:exodeoxyribonuclease III